jgi:ferredoxin-nitrate reductase
MMKVGIMHETIRTTCSYCGVGCGVRVQQRPGGRLHLTGDDDHPVNHGLLCSKGRYLHHTVMNREERLIYPMLRPCRDAPLARVDWHQALRRAAAVFHTLIARFGPRSVGMYVSGQMLTEEYYLANKLVKGFWGCNNIDTNSRLCMSSAATAYKLALGDDLVPICYNDIDQADCLLIAGANPAWCHPILFRRMERRKQAQPEMRLIVVDPRRTESCELADLHLQIQPGTDVTLYHALARWLIEHDRIDHAFIERHTEGFAALRERVMGTTLDDAAARCRILVEQIHLAARWIARSQGLLTLWAMGLNQSHIGVEKNLALINLNLLTGQIGRPGAGPFSLTGQPNAMGGREVGGMATLLAAHHELNNPEHRRKVAEFWGVGQIDDQPGLTATQMFEALERDELKAIWIVCTNPAVSLPNLGKFERALRRARFVVVQDISARSDTAAFADLLLPAAGWLEKTGTMTNSERRVSYLPKLIEPPGEALPDAEIFCRFAQVLGHGKAFHYADSAEVFAEYARLTRGTAIDLAGMSHARLAREGSLQWPCPTSDHPGTPRLFADRHFATPSGRARLHAVETSEQPSTVSNEFPLILTTGRIRDQWHTMTRTGTVGRLRQHTAEPLLEIHPHDAADLAITDNQPIEIASRDGHVLSRARLTPTLKRGVVFLPMHWGRALGNGMARANNLTSGACDPRSMEPDFKFTAVNVRSIVMPRRRIVVIGGGAASLAFVRRYRTLNHCDELIVFSEEPQPYYNRILLPELIAGTRPWESLVSCSAAELGELAVRFVSDRRIVQINPRNRWVEDAQGERHDYDVLVLATGSRPRLPAGLPRDLPGIFTLRNRHDAERMAADAAPGEQAVILGGGLLGLEAAAALRGRQMRVAVLQRSNRLMRQQLDTTAAQMLQEQLAEQDIEVILNDSVDQVIGHNRLRRVHTQAGRHIACNLLLAAAGIEPNAELGRAAGLEGAGGIRVDEQMRSSDPAIYAIGEVAEFAGRCCGTTRATEAQAQVAAAAIAGDPLVTYRPVAEVTVLKIPGMRLAALGTSSVEAESVASGYETVHVLDRNRHYYKKCVLQHDHLVGAILVGDLSELSEWHQYIESGIELEEIRDRLLRGGATTVTRCTGPVICSCHNVGEGNLQQAVAEGCDNLETLMTKSRAGTGCGSCRPAIRRLWEACQASTSTTLEEALL